MLNSHVALKVVKVLQLEPETEQLIAEAHR